MLYPMYRKLLFIITIFFAPYILYGQTYYEVTGLGSQMVGGNTITVTPNNTGGIGNICQAMITYGIGGVNGIPNSVSFAFANPVTRLKFLIAHTHHTEIISLKINNVLYSINSSQITHYAGSCNMDAYITVVNGKLEAASAPYYAWGSGAQMDIITGGPITNVELIHNSIGTGSTFRLFFSDYDTLVHINSPVQSHFCVGDTFSLHYDVTFPFNTGNSFTAQLSDATGSFASPVNIGASSSTAAGSIFCTLPANTPQGSGYRVRIVPTSPAHISLDNGSDITIDPYPTQPIAGANTPLCEGSNLNLTCTNGGTGTSYNWTGPSFTSTQQNPVRTSATTGMSGDYIVTADIGGCALKDTVTADVRIVPAMPTVPNNITVCPGTDLHLSASSATQGAAYNWAGPSFASTQQNPIISPATTANAGNYYVTASLNGCTSAAAAINVAVTITTPTPAASSNSPVCTGGILQLAASTISGATYNWTGPNNFNSTQQNPTVNPVPATGAGTYDVTATINGCISLPGSTNVIVNTVTYLGIYASPDDTICAGNPVTVVTVPVNGGTSPAFQWYKNNTQIPGANKLTYKTITPATGDSFFCRMIANNICNTPITLYSDTIGITVLQKTPIPWVSISSNPAQPIPGNPVIFTATPTNGGNHPEYQWQRNGTDIAGATSNTWSSNGLNPYDKIRVRLTVAEPCPDGPNPVYSDSIEVNFPQGIGSTGPNTPLYLYPNPNNGEFVLEGQSPANDKLTIEIINYLGQTVYTEQLQPGHNTMYKALHLHRQLAPGAYLLKVQNRAVRFVVY